MAGGTITHAGKRVYISATLPATNDESGFESASITWTEIGEVINASGWGKNYSEATRQPLKDRMVKRQKGGYDYNPLTIEATVDTADAGQELALAASGSDNAYSVKEVYSNGDAKYAQCLIMTFEDDTGGGINDFVDVSITAQPIEDVVRTLAE